MSSHLAAAEYIEEALRRDGHVTISAIGYSMMPLISPNSTIKIKKCAGTAFTVGDILLVKRESSFILHRLCEIQCKEKLLFVTKGDNNRRHDPPVDGSLALGKVVAVGSSGFKKLLWLCANRIVILLTLDVQLAHKRVSKKNWYKVLFKIKSYFAGRKSLLSPVVKKLETFPFAIAFIQKKLCGSYHFARMSFLLPKTHLVELLPVDSGEAAYKLWERVFPRLKIETPESLKRYLFFHFLSDRPICYLAMNKNRCLGLISAAVRFPGFRGQTICSLEALAVDPDERRKSIGSALLDRLMKECQNRNVVQMSTCRNRLFFPGLHPEYNGQAIDFLIHNGFETPVFFDEMILTPETHKQSAFLNAGGEKDTGKKISFGLLEAGQKTVFLEFLKREYRELSERYISTARGWECFDSPQSQGIVFAEYDGKIIGTCRYDCLANGWGHATPDRWIKLSNFPEAAPSNVYVFSNLLISRLAQRAGIGSMLANHCFSQIFKFGGKLIFLETTLPTFFLRFGAIKINPYIVLNANVIRSSN